MLKANELVQEAVSKRRLTDEGLNALRKEIYANKAVDRDEAELIYRIHQAVEELPTGFDEFFNRAIKTHLLHDGVVTTEESEWLSRITKKGGRLHRRDLRLLSELHLEAAGECEEFKAFLNECLRGA